MTISEVLKWGYDGGRFTVLTREAKGCMVGIHNRMPLILTRDDLEKWLFSKKEAVMLLLLKYNQIILAGTAVLMYTEKVAMIVYVKGRKYTIKL